MIEIYGLRLTERANSARQFVARSSTIVVLLRVVVLPLIIGLLLVVVLLLEVSLLLV
jgi:hypothetical protein